MGTADPPAAVVQRLQEEHLRKDVIGYGSLGEALTAQGGRAEEASKAFDDALACCPAGVPPHLQRAYAHYCGAYAALCEEKGDRQRAQELYERGLSVHPTCPTCLGNLPLFLQSCKRPSNEIEAAYKAYFAEYPESVPVLVKYANFLRHAMRAPDRAETILKKAIGISEDADALGAYAVLLHAVRPHDPLTEQLYGRAVKADPAAVNALSNYGLYLSEMKRDYAKAKKIYEQALTADPAHANSCYNYAVMLDSGLNDVEGAVQLYERALKAKPTHAYALYNLAVVCEEKLNDHERAGSLYERAVAAAPRDSLAPCLCGSQPMILVNLRQSPRHRADAVTGTMSRRWRGAVKFDFHTGRGGPWPLRGAAGRGRGRRGPGRKGRGFITEGAGARPGVRDCPRGTGRDRLECRRRGEREALLQGRQGERPARVFSKTARGPAQAA